MKFAVVVGHNRLNQGAVNYMGESEYSFNKRIAKKLLLKLADKKIDIQIIIRRPEKSLHEESHGVIDFCVREQITHTFHLHFNSYDKLVKGCEVLVPSNNINSVWIADLISDELNICFGFKERGDDGVKRVQQTHRGGLMLNSLSSVGITPVLIEPCFANYRHFESKQIFEDEHCYVLLLARCISKIKTKIEIKENKDA